MRAKNKKIDAYIAKSADFAKPVLSHIRNLVHKACPKTREVIKWGFPHFDYKGMMCSMAAFKHHCAFNFWKESLMNDSKKILKIKDKDSMGSLGQIKSKSDLPHDNIFISYIKEAMKLNDEGVKLTVKKKDTGKTELVIPDCFFKALKKNKKAQVSFEKFAYSHRKEYIMWITEAKTEETRNRRIETAVEWLSEGKSRNWKYEKK
ncbi:MAG: YdeI/OmpD-associated family protein [Ignavibacteriae bacterium]|nr:YdeI/OmpD-associated family protein [Ignavibacteriota bacterium]